MTKRTSYQILADAILAALDTAAPWRRPWVSQAPLSMPVNAVTGRRYRGGNVVMLWLAAQQAGYTTHAWATFKQWAEKGASVRKGEKGTPVLWFQMLERKDGKEADEGDEADSRKVPVARLSWVFNVAQVEGYTPPAVTPSAPQVEPVAAAEALMLASGARIRHEGDRAYYRPSTDEIVLPPKAAFVATPTSTATEAYYATALHELVHWTAPRVGRELRGRFGDAEYAAEELVAELGAAFLCAELGVSNHPREDHAAYIRSWIELLRHDPRAFTSAASKAAEASDFLLTRAAAEPALAA